LTGNQGLIHRDLKPNNCFIDDSGAVKVGDFGLSRESSDPNNREEADTELKNPTVIDNSDITAGVGTRSYASPEQMKGGSEYDSSTDIYSLGIILFELCYPMYTVSPPTPKFQIDAMVGPCLIHYPLPFCFLLRIGNGA
jgi:serine/threonine protein kinase